MNNPNIIIYRNHSINMDDICLIKLNVNLQQAHTLTFYHKSDHYSYYKFEYANKELAIDALHLILKTAYKCEIVKINDDLYNIVYPEKAKYPVINFINE